MRQIAAPARRQPRVWPRPRHASHAASTAAKPSDAHSQDLSYRDRAAPRDGDDHPTISLAPGGWPRVFSGL